MPRFSARALCFLLCLAATLAAASSKPIFHKHSRTHKHKKLKPNAHEVEVGFLKMGDAPPKMLTARQHGKMMLECSATGNPAPTIVWMKDGHPVFKKSSMAYDKAEKFPASSMSETRARLELDCISEKDAGVYECVAHTTSGKTIAITTEVNVVSFGSNGCSTRKDQRSEAVAEAAPRINQWASTYMQPMGGHARLVCRADGKHRTTWFGPDNKRLAANFDNGDIERPTSDPDKYVVLDNGDLLIRNLSFEDMGMFKCFVSNSSGEDMQETFVYPHSPI